MKVGDIVYVPKLDQYGFINEVNPAGRIVSIRSFNKHTRRLDLIQVIDLVVEAVGLIKKLYVIVKMVFAKKNPA